MGTMNVQDKWVMCVVWVGLMFGCESKNSPPASSQQAIPRGKVLVHVSQPVLERHLDAYIYGDMVGAVQTHVASTEESTWCRSRSFTNLFEELRRNKDDAACEQAVALTSEEQAQGELEDEELLMMQTMRFVCERPHATCQDYAQSVYRSALAQTPYWTARLERYEIREMNEAQPGEVRAYVDLHFPAPLGTKRELVVLKSVREGGNTQWFVQQGLEAL